VRDAALAVLGDGLTVAPLARVASLHSASQGNGNTYFAHILPGDSIPSREFPQVKPQTRSLNQNEINSSFLSPQRPGSVKGEDVVYWLAQPLLPPGWPSLLMDKANYSQQDAQMSKACVHYLGNFIRSG
jgi:Carboxylesterase family